MGWLFAIAAEMYVREIGPPDEWSYNAGAMGGDPRDEGDYSADVCKQATDEDLEYWGEILMRHRNWLESQGENY
jgi:hypothetical protein